MADPDAIVVGSGPNELTALRHVAGVRQAPDIGPAEPSPAASAGVAP